MEGQGQAGPAGGPLQDIQSYLTDFNKEIADNGSQQQFQAAEAPAEQSDLYDVALTEPTTGGNQINGEQEIQEEQTQETVTVSQIQETQIVVPESQEATQDMSQVTTVPETQEIPQGQDETQSDVQISVEGTLVEQHIVTSETGQVLAQVASESHGAAVVLGDLGVQQLAVQSAAGQTQQQVQVEQAMSQPEIVHLQQPEQQVLDAGLAGQVHLVNANQTIPQTIVIQQPVVENIVQHHTLEGQDIAQVAAAVSQTMPALQGAQVVTDQQMQMQMQQTEQGTIYIQQEVPGQQATEYVTQAALGQQGITVVSLPQGMSVSQSNAAILDAVAQHTVGVPVPHEHTQLVTVSQVAHHHVPEQQQELVDTETPETQQVTVSVTETTLPQPVVKDPQVALKTTTGQQKDSVQASLEPIQIKPQDSEKAERETTKAEVLAQISVQNTEEEQEEEDAVKQKQEKTTQEEEQQPAQAEEGTDEQQAEEEGEEAAEEEAPQEGQGDGQNFQTVTLVPSDVNQGGEVSYVLIVSQGEDGDKGDGKMDMSVYDFKEEGRIITTEEQTTTDAQGRKIIKVTPKKNPQTSSGQLMCNYCNYTSTKRYLLTRHMKTHSEERPHKCNICDRAFKTIVSLTNHINTHTGTRPHRCKECDAAFTTSGELVRHVRYRHTFEKPHKCPECDYSSVELSKLKRHIRSHTGERPYQCPHCSYASPDTYKLKRHLRVHTGEKPYECEFCHARFTQSNSLKAHKLIHSGSKPVYQCELCPTTCGRKTDLKIHIQKLHTSDKPLMCKKCGKSFPDRYTYKLHVKTHEGEKCFRCELCPYAALSQRHLESHILTHTGEKPFQCNECDQSFRQKQLLKRHKNLYHTPDYVPPAPKDKAYECTECQKTFAHKGNLLRHLMHHDPDLQLSKEMLDSSLQEVIITDNTDQNTILVSQADDTPRTISTTTVRRRAKTGPATTALEIPVQTVQLVQVVDESGQNTTQILLQMEDGSTPVVAGTTSRAAFREIEVEEGEEEVMEKQEMEEEEEDEPIIPKKEEPVAETATPKKRGRGRPPKRQIQVEEAQEEDEEDKLQEKKEDEGEEEEEEGTATAGRRSPRTRGIVKTQATPTKTATAKSPARRGRGRPPAAAAAPPPEPEEEEEVQEEEVMQESPATPKSRGRKRKAASPEDEEAEVEEEGDDEEMESPMKKLRRQQRKTPQKGKRSVQDEQARKDIEECFGFDTDEKS